MKRIALNDLEGEIVWVKFNDQLRLETIFFVCPICLEANEGKRPGVHSHGVPFRRGEAKGASVLPITHVWGHTSGSTIDDITLTPSYLATGGGCRLHCFIRNGQVVVLADSKLTR